MTDAMIQAAEQAKAIIGTMQQNVSLKELALEQSRIIAAFVKEYGGKISGEVWDEVHERREMIPYIASARGDDVRIETK